MKAEWTMPYANTLSQALEKRLLALDAVQADLLQRVYRVKGRAAVQARHAASCGYAIAQDIASFDASLGAILEPAMVADPDVFNGEDVVYAVAGHPVTFKIDTGTKGIVVDARNIHWGKMQDETIKAAHLAYAEEHPNSGNLTKEKLVAFSESYRDLDFGVVDQFDLALHEGKDDKDYRAVTLQGPFPVLAVSRPKNTSGKRAETMRPVIAMPMRRDGFGEETVAPVNLVARKELTRRGLLGKDFLEGKKIIYGQGDTRVLDLDKVDCKAVAACLQSFHLSF